MNATNKIFYSSVNEDSTSEFKALEIKAKDKILCITGSGARPLDLLTKLPAEIIAIDINPAQNYLLELKMAAIKKLNYEEYTKFLGLVISDNRLSFYNRIKPLLSEPAVKFWNNNFAMIKKGVLYQGNWEKYFSLLSLLLKILKKNALYNLFNSHSTKEQEVIWDKSINDCFWRTFLKIISFRIFWKTLLGDPGFYKYVPTDFSVYQYLNKKFNQGISKLLYCESPFLNLLFNGKLNSINGLPPHLQKENYELLKNNIERIKIITSSITEFVANSKKSFDCFSLSDISSYTNVYEYVELFRGIQLKANKHARICERQFLVKRQLPKSFYNRFEQNLELENELEQSDNSLFYTFHCYRLKGDFNE